MPIYPSTVLAFSCRSSLSGFAGITKWLLRVAVAHGKPARAAEQATDGEYQESICRGRQTYGSPRIHADLKALGVACGIHRVARLMRKAFIRPVPARRFVATTDSDHALPVAQNCLNREFSAEKVDARWVSDITYLWTAQGWLYLAVVLDLFSRRIVGWSLAPTLHKEVVLNALEMAMQGRRAEAGLLLHSDRGSQYASLAYQERLLQAGVTCSMSRKGNPSESGFRCAGITHLRRVSLQR